MTQTRRSCVLRAILLQALLSPAAARERAGANAQERIEVPARPGVTEAAYASFVPNARATLILFPGGNGLVAAVRKNVLIRIAPDLNRQGYSTAIADAPSDHATGMTVSFRLSQEHMRDVSALVDAVKARVAAPVWLVGTSNGSVSAGAAASNLGNRIAGVILTSSVWGNGMAGVPMEKITAPTLIIHNRDDGCMNSPYAGAGPALRRLTAAPVRELISVSGGRSQGEACGAMAPHGYLEIEPQIVAAITGWVSSHTSGH